VICEGFFILGVHFGVHFLAIFPGPYKTNFHVCFPDPNSFSWNFIPSTIELKFTLQWNSPGFLPLVPFFIILLPVYCFNLKFRIHLDSFLGMTGVVNVALSMTQETNTIKKATRGQ
jgi:hypothetical protein